MLDADGAAEALKIVESSNSKDEMRKGVLSTREAIKRAFISAHFGCSLYNLLHMHSRRTRFTDFKVRNA